MSLTEQHATDRLRVLIVEDNRDTADSLATLLQMCGYEASTAYDGPSGLRAARALRPDCIVLDIGLPGLDGYTVAGRVRQDEALRAATLIAVTAYPDEGRALASGFDYHLTKPASLAALVEVLRKLPAGRRGEEHAPS